LYTLRVRRCEILCQLNRLARREIAQLFCECLCGWEPFIWICVAVSRCYQLLLSRNAESASDSCRHYEQVPDSCAFGKVSLHPSFLCCHLASPPEGGRSCKWESESFANESLLLRQFVHEWICSSSMCTLLNLKIYCTGYLAACHASGSLHDIVSAGSELDQADSTVDERLIMINRDIGPYPITVYNSEVRYEKALI
jgi:hypothetical protein